MQRNGVAYSPWWVWKIKTNTYGWRTVKGSLIYELHGLFTWKKQKLAGLFRLSTFAQEIVTKKICFWVCCIVEFTFYSDGLMIHPSPFLNVIRMSMPTVSFLVLLDFGILYWQNVSLWFKMHLIFLIKTSFYMSKKSRQKCKYLKNEKRF